MTPPRLNQFGQPIGPSLPNWRVPAIPSRDSLEGRFCQVVPIHERLVDELYDAIVLDDDERHWTYLPYGPFGTKDAYRAWIETSCASADPLIFAILSVETGKAVGISAYLRITPGSGSIEVGHLFFSTRLRRTPAATEAMYLMMRRAFELGYRRYEWKCDAFNAPSRAAAERLGFSFEGIFRQHTVVKGRSRDTAWYSIIDSEWPRLERAFRVWLDPANFDGDGRQRVSLGDLTRVAPQP